jgi:hypothetical protein
MYRWTARRKAKLVFDIIDSNITLDQACAQYDLSVAKIVEWKDALERDAMRALRGHAPSLRPSQTDASEWSTRVPTG